MFSETSLKTWICPKNTDFLQLVLLISFLFSLQKEKNPPLWFVGCVGQNGGSTPCHQSLKQRYCSVPFFFSSTLTLRLRVHSHGSELLTTHRHLVPIHTGKPGQPEHQSGGIEPVYEIRGREEEALGLFPSQTASCPMRRRTLPMLICSKARSEGGSDTEERRKR